MQVNKTNCELSLVKNYKFEMMKNTDKIIIFRCCKEH